ncbi:hypothetical protein HDV02_004308 [Globomyces sp. JEL0801]|nr:hypothetical protein HDV02_004308 [Globomyces sp. JEL0801]
MKGQSINIPGIRAAVQSIFRPSLLVPVMVVPDMRSIPFVDLHKRGFKAIVFDKDNTLTAPYKNDIHPPFLSAFNECKKVFVGKVAVVSNSAGSIDDVGNKLASHLSVSLGIPIITQRDKKPLGADQLPKYFDCQPHEIIVVGDRLTTDIIYGNRIGAMTIFCTNVITLENDNPMAIKVSIIALTICRSDQ